MPAPIPREKKQPALPPSLSANCLSCEECWLCLLYTYNFSVPVEEKERVEEIVIEDMEHAYRMHVPLKADCGWGKNWLEAH